MANQNAAVKVEEGVQRDATRRAAKNTLILVSLRVMIPLFSFALVITLSRVLGTEGLGRYTLVFSFLTLLSALGPLGLGPVIVREGAGKPSTLGLILTNAIAIGTVASIVLTFIMSALGAALDYDPATRSALSILSLAILPSTIYILLDRAFIALERPIYIALAMTVEHLLKIGGGIALLFLGFGLNAVLIVAIAGKCLACLTLFYYLRRAGVNLQFKTHGRTLKKLSKLAPTFSLITIFSLIHWRIDIFMLSKLRPIDDIGQYGAAYRLFNFGVIFPQSLCLSLYPQIATAIRTNEAKLSYIVRMASKYLFAAALPVAICTTILAEQILTLLYGESFQRATFTLSILIWTIIPYSLVRLNAYILVAAGLQKIDLLLNVIASIINVCFNFILIPQYGHTGAATTTLISICILCAAQLTYLRMYIGANAVQISVHPAVIVNSFLVGFFAYALQEVSVMFVIFSASILYIGGLIVSGFFCNEELFFFNIGSLLNKFTTRLRSSK